MLRPLLPDVPADEFPGIRLGKTFQVTAKWHSDLANHLVQVPQLLPGDAVWFHPDLVSPGFFLSAFWSHPISLGDTET